MGASFYYEEAVVGDNTMEMVRAAAGSAGSDRALCDLLNGELICALGN